MFSAGKSRMKQEFGSYLDSSLPGCYVCALSAWLMLVFLSRFVLLQTGVRRRDLALRWGPSGSAFLRCGAALPASPSTYRSSLTAGDGHR